MSRMIVDLITGNPVIITVLDFRECGCLGPNDRPGTVYQIFNVTLVLRFSFSLKCLANFQQ